MIQPRFTPDSTLAAIERHAITSAAMVPTQFVRMLKLDEELRNRFDVSSMQWIRLPDGRFTVGDIGWLDDEGYLYLADRRVDLIITGGSNVYPAEIEAVLVEHPAVGDAAVFGIPDPEWGQQVKAVIEPSGDAPVDIDDVRAFAASKLASFRVPRSFDIVDALPREAHGKLKKRVLREPYWQ